MYSSFLRGKKGTPEVFSILYISCLSPPELLIVAVSARLVSQSQNLSCWIQNLSFCQDWEIQNKLQKQRNSMKKNLVEELRARAGWEVEVSAWILLLLPLLVRSVPQPGVSLSTPFCWRLVLITSGALLFCPSGPLWSPSPPSPPCPPIPGKLGVAHLRAFSSCRHSLAAARFLRIEGILLRDGPSRRLWKKGGFFAYSSHLAELDLVAEPSLGKTLS